MKTVAVLFLIALSCNAGEIEGLKDFLDGIHKGYFKTPVSDACFDDEAQTKYVHQASNLFNDIFSNVPQSQLITEFYELVGLLYTQDIKCEFTKTFSNVHQAFANGLEEVLTRALFHSMELEIHAQNFIHAFGKTDYLAAGKSLGHCLRVLSGQLGQQQIQILFSL